ncbi:MAG: ribonuclease J [Clostridiales bacterium]|nr:ribonuclease J [Clostridiales bacterium]
MSEKQKKQNKGKTKDVKTSTVQKAKKPAKEQKTSKSSKPKASKQKKNLKIIPLGGLLEIGKNMTAIEYGNDIIVIDVGMAFGGDDTPGVDCVIQDYTYIRENQDKLRGILLTHGHEDHIGALPYFLKEFKCPVYGGKLTVELVRHKLEDNGVSLKGIGLNACRNGDRIRLGSAFEAEFVRVNHSIADSYAIALRTPVGLIVHSGDFKIDYTPINGKVIDLQRFGELGHEGVLCFMCESTNVEKEGASPSERDVGEAFQKIFKKAEGRIIVATFSSHVHRMQQIFTAAQMNGRHVCLSGRSMINVFNIANSLGYIDMDPDTLIDIGSINKYPDNEVVVLTTGSQAEPTSALSRMAFASHKEVEIRDGDTVIISAHPIPGNEKSIYKLVDELLKRGADVIYESLAEVHVSGHAYRNEIRLLHTLLKPKFFIPVHGEYRMLIRHAQLAQSLGQDPEDIFILRNGDVFETDGKKAVVTGEVPAEAILIDGSSAAVRDDHFMSDRLHLGEDGCVSIAITIDTESGELACEPAVSSIGFIVDDEKQELHEAVAERVTYLLSSGVRKNETIDAKITTRSFRNGVRDLLYERTRRRPMIVTNVSHVSLRGASRRR